MAGKVFLVLGFLQVLVLCLFRSIFVGHGKVSLSFGFPSSADAFVTRMALGTAVHSHCQHEDSL